MIELRELSTTQGNVQKDIKDKDWPAYLIAVLITSKRKESIVRNRKIR